MPSVSVSFQSFFRGLEQVSVPRESAPADHEARIAAVEPGLRQYVEAFASQIPVVQSCAYADDWRRTNIGCVVSLCAYSGYRLLHHKDVSMPV